MSDPQEIEMVLAHAQLELVGRVIVMGVEEPRYIAQIKIKRDSNGHQVPSNPVLWVIKKRIEEKGKKIDFILHDQEKEDVEVDMRATMLHQFPDQVRNLYISRNTRNIFIWIEPATSQLEKGIRENLSLAIKEISSVKEIKGINIFFTTDFLTPTPTDVLNIIRIEAPITLEKIIADLKKEEFEVPGDTFISRIVDGLRKRNYVVRQKDDGFYILTLNALKTLGTAKNKTSPDLTRLLDMARRG